MLATRNYKTIILSFGDLAAAYLGLIAALALRYGPEAFRLHWHEHAVPFTIVFLIWLVIFYIVGLYDFEVLRSRIQLASRALEGFGAALLISAAIFYAMPGITIAPKTNLIIVVGSSAVIFGIWRLGAMYFFAHERFRLKVVFLGEDPETRQVCSALSENTHLGYACAGIVDPAALGTLPACDILVVARRVQHRPEIAQSLYRQFLASVRIVDFPQFFENIHHAIPASVLDERWVIENLAHQEEVFFEHAKRSMDLFFFALLVLPTLVLSPFICLAIWLEDRGPMLYRQIRVGKGGKLFSIVKFRTMRTDAERHGAMFAQENDPRITRTGRFLRATRLDELPQLWNILRGDMSLVGPRPERPEIEAELEKSIPLFPVRHLLRPGLTGWAQVSAPYAAAPADHVLKLRHDLYYLKYRSFALDAAIILKTIYSVLKHQGR